MAAIGAWTTPHLAAAVEALRAEGGEVLDEHLAHLSPLVWGHVNFLGTYAFDPGAARGLDNLRPLRSGLPEEDDDEEGIVAW